MCLNPNVLNRVFTKQSINSLVDNKPNSELVLENAIKQCSLNMNLEKNVDLLSQIYLYMSKNYRNEYFYTNTLLNKLLLGKHSLSTSTAITQLPIANSKADFILLNGKAVVYEIKTELDSFERLEDQIKDYYKAFTYVNVITSENNYKKLNNLLKDTPTGICVLSNKNTIQIKKVAQYNDKYLNKHVIFKILRKYEFENIIKKIYKILPKATPAFYYDECYKIFEEISLNELYPLFRKELKKRNKVLDITNFKAVPYELKTYAYFSNLNTKYYNKIFEFLNHNYKGETKCIIRI